MTKNKYIIYRLADTTIHLHTVKKTIYFYWVPWMSLPIILHERFLLWKKEKKNHDNDKRMDCYGCTECFSCGIYADLRRGFTFWQVHIVSSLYSICLNATQTDFFFFLLKKFDIPIQNTDAWLNTYKLHVRLGLQLVTYIVLLCRISKWDCRLFLMSRWNSLDRQSNRYYIYESDRIVQMNVM